MWTQAPGPARSHKAVKQEGAAARSGSSLLSRHSSNCWPGSFASVTLGAVSLQAGQGVAAPLYSTNCWPGSFTSVTLGANSLQAGRGAAPLTGQIAGRALSLPGLWGRLPYRGGPGGGRSPLQLELLAGLFHVCDFGGGLPAGGAGGGRSPLQLELLAGLFHVHNFGSEFLIGGGGLEQGHHGVVPPHVHGEHVLGPHRLEEVLHPQVEVRLLPGV